MDAESLFDDVLQKRKLVEAGVLEGSVGAEVSDLFLIELLGDFRL